MARFGIAHHTGYTLNYYYQPLQLTVHFHPSGCKWRERRRLLTPSFHYNILEFIDTFNEQSLIMCTKINELCHEKTTIEIDVTNLTNYCSLDIICGNAVFCDDFFLVNGSIILLINYHFSMNLFPFYFPRECNGI